MVKTIKINGKEITPAEFTYNLMCDLEDIGVSIALLEEKPMSAARGYLAVSTGMSKQQAGKEIEQHIVNGGTLQELMNAMLDNLKDSGFFRGMHNPNVNPHEEDVQTETADQEQPTEQ